MLLLHLQDYAQAVSMFFYTAPAGMGLPYCRTPQGKVAELRLELNSGGKKDKNNSSKKIALKKIVANMTMSNNDMVNLFPDVVNCMQISSLEIKKMYVRDQSWRRQCFFSVDITADGLFRCFLFLVNYARIKPDVALKALPILENVSSVVLKVAPSLTLTVRRTWKTPTL